MKKEKKPQTLKSRISAAKTSIVIWSIVAVIWLFLGVMRAIDGDDWWLVALNFFVGIVSAIDVFLNIRNLKKLQKEEDGQNTQNS